MRRQIEFRQRRGKCARRQFAACELAGSEGIRRFDKEWLKALVDGKLLEEVGACLVAAHWRLGESVGEFAIKRDGGLQGCGSAALFFKPRQGRQGRAIAAAVENLMQRQLGC